MGSYQQRNSPSNNNQNKLSNLNLLYNSFLFKIS